MDEMSKEIRKRHMESSGIRFIRTFDTLLSFIVNRINNRKIGRFNRILVSNLGDIGDVIISTNIISVIKKAFPDAKIGYLLKPYTRSVIEGHPDITWIHSFDKWPLRINPAKQDLASFKTFIKILKDSLEFGESLSSFNYDVAIDLRAFLPNSTVALWKAKIPVRIGYDKAGFSPLLTHVLEYPFLRQHESAYHLQLCNKLPITEYPREVSINLPDLYESSMAELLDLLGESASIPKYRVLHTGSSQATRDWPENYWRQLATQLVENGHLLVFTGKGKRDSNRISSIIRDLPNCINACDRLSYHGFVNSIKHAELVYSVETAAGHIAAATDTPVVWIHSGMTDAKQWAPLSSKSRILQSNRHCSPCFRIEACESLKCMWDINPSDVYEAGESLLICSECHGVCIMQGR